MSAPFSVRPSMAGSSWWTTDGGRRLWTTFGTRFVMPSTRASREAWESLYYKFVDVNKAVNVRSPGGRNKTKNASEDRDVKERGDTCCDQSYATNTLSVWRRSAKSSELRNFGAQPLPCQRRWGKWKRGNVGSRAFLGWREQKLILT